MAVAGHLHKIVVGGKLAQTESWSISLHYLRDTPDALILGPSLQDAFTQWFARITSQINKLATLDYLKANELNPAAVANTGGKPMSPPFTRYLAQGAVNEIYFSPGFAGATEIGNAPPQCTQAVSLTTGFTRGPAHMGRFYPPSSWANGASCVDATGRFPAGDTAGMVTSALQLITDVNTSNDGNVVVYSAIGPTTQPVTGVRIGRVIDTQRRRRKNLLEDYQVGVLT